MSRLCFSYKIVIRPHSSVLLVLFPSFLALPNCLPLSSEDDVRGSPLHLEAAGTSFGSHRLSDLSFLSSTSVSFVRRPWPLSSPSVSFCPPPSAISPHPSRHVAVFYGRLTPFHHGNDDPRLSAAHPRHLCHRDTLSAAGVGPERRRRPEVAHLDQDATDPELLPGWHSRRSSEGTEYVAVVREQQRQRRGRGRRPPRIEWDAEGDQRRRNKPTEKKKHGSRRRLPPEARNLCCLSLSSVPSRCARFLPPCSHANPDLFFCFSSG